jgi:hypothetical protein
MVEESLSEQLTLPTAPDSYRDCLLFTFFHDENYHFSDKLKTKYCQLLSRISKVLAI